MKEGFVGLTMVAIAGFALVGLTMVAIAGFVLISIREGNRDALID